LTVSFTHPHDPYVARKKYWDLYENCSYLLPEVGTISYENHDVHSKRIFDANDWRSYEIDDAMIERSRRAYFANISYLDDQIGELLKTLEETDQEAIIIFVSDHGDMLGERGLWFKMSFFEGSARVPLMISSSSMSSQVINSPVSTIDLCPTICELAGVTMSEVTPWITGESLCGLIQGEKRENPVLMEYAAEASHAPLVCIRKDRWKYISCSLDPEQLFDLDKDPNELDNLIEKTGYKSITQSFRDIVEATWNLDRFDQDVRESQAKRKVVYEALRKGGYYPWDFQPLKQASERYMRNHLDLNILESSQRYPSDD
jgi:choline-sulfatase